MKFLIVGDLHGKVPKFYYKGFDTIIAPGDFCSDATRKYMFQSLRQWLKNPGSARTAWYELVGRTKARKMIKKSVADGRKVLKKLNSFGVPVFIVPGNWEWTQDKNADWSFLRKDNYSIMKRGLKNIRDVHNKIASAKHYNVIGYGLSFGPEYPQYRDEKKRYSSFDLKMMKKEYEGQVKKLSSLFRKAKKPVIFLSHNVPFKTSIDKITDRKSPRYGRHYGSVVARKVIEKHRPLVCIGGHMHEHFGKTRIGRTVCINTGFGPHVNTWMELKNNKVENLQFHRGR